MGCGKSTVGKQLAKRMGYAFVDIDSYIEETSGRSINQVFEQDGEGTFRVLERAALLQHLNAEDAVIATGGGLPCNENNMELMLEAGMCVYIQLDAGALASRLYDGRSTRPLIKDLDKHGLKEYIASKLQEREPFYTQAQIVVDGLSLKSPEKLDELITRLDHSR